MAIGWDHYVATAPDVRLEKLAIQDTRITGELILEKLAAGETIDDLLLAHPRLTRQGRWQSPSSGRRSSNGARRQQEPEP